jgi:hypothetical protein
MINNLCWGVVNVSIFVDGALKVEHKEYVNCEVRFQEHSDTRVQSYGGKNWGEERNYLAFFDSVVSLMTHKVLIINAKTWKMGEERKCNVQIHCSNPFIRVSFEDCMPD